MILALLILAAAAVLAAFFASDIRKSPDLAPEQQEVWQAAIANERSAVGRILLNVARPISRSGFVSREAATPQWRALRRKLAASGSFSSDVEVFLAVQVVCAILGMVVVAFAATMSSTMSSIAVMVSGVALAAYPWNIVKKSSMKRYGEVMDNLPDFAELLQMPLAAGMGIIPALRFTSERLQGPVSAEVVRMLDIIRVNPSEEAHAFIDAGERLGVTEARAFFTALLQSHLEGASVSQNLSRQAEVLRTAAFQRRRSSLKRLPVKLVLIIGMHFIPVILILAMLPTMLSFGQV
jgi:Flp pilus assembly protein TadB